MLRDVLKLGGRLLLFAMVAGALLGLVNSVTAGPIEANGRRNTEQALLRVLPDVSGDAEEIDGLFANESVTYAWLYKSDGRNTGCAIKLQTTGYAGAIEMLVGVGPDGKVTGLEILSHSETPGLGSLAAEPAFSERFIGVTSPVTMGEGGVQAISGATVSTRAVISGTNIAIEEAKRIMAVGK